MTVQSYDTVKYHGEICVVEQVWSGAEGVGFAQLRELDHETHGTYIVLQDDDEVRLYLGA